MKLKTHIRVALLLVLLAASSPAPGQTEASVARGATQLFTIAAIADFDLDENGESDLVAMTCFEKMLVSGDFPEVERVFLANRTLAETAIGRTTITLASEAGAAIAFYATTGARNGNSESIAADLARKFAAALAGPGLTSDFDETQAAVVAEFLLGCEEDPPKLQDTKGISGVVSDFEGNFLSAPIKFWIADEILQQGTRSDNEGRFQSPTLFVSPVAIEVALDGYQAKVLIQGRDFEIGDQAVQVRLRRGPFVRTESTFTQVFGMTRDELEHYPDRWKRLWERIPEYRRLAGNKKVAWLRVRDSDGGLLSEIDMLQWRGPQMGLPTASAFARRSVLKAADSTNVFEVEFPPIYVWTAGHGGVWFRPKYRPEYGELTELVLPRAGSLTLTVVGAANEPLPGLKAIVLRKGPSGLYEGGADVRLIEEVTNEHGILRFDRVAPGTYSAYLYHEGQLRRNAEFSVAPGAPTEIKVVVDLSIHLLGGD